MSESSEAPSFEDVIALAVAANEAAGINPPSGFDADAPFITEDRPMTAMPLRDFTDAEKARLDAIEAAPAAEESLRERVAEALYETTEAAEYHEWPDAPGADQTFAYALADAAIDVLRGPSSDAEQAVERVLALADEHYACCHFIAVWDLRRAVAGD
jgi:hypothetical protein